MNTLRLIVAAAISALWIGGYLAAYFIDPKLGDLATSANPVMLIVAGFLFGGAALELLKGKTDK